MKIFGQFFILLISLISFHSTLLLAQAQDYRDEIKSLLDKLLPVEVTIGQNTIVQGPNSETRQQVRDRLIKIANESSQSKSQVVEALIRVLEEPPSTEQSLIALRWTTAVDMLGDLRATEAIDILVRNLDQTGQNGIIISLHYRPVAHAISKIGKAAVPRLIEALTDENPDIRYEAAVTLARIGQNAFALLEEALHSGSAETKGGAALALAWIGGKEARVAIERAIEIERDQEALTRLKDALKEIVGWGK